MIIKINNITWTILLIDGEDKKLNPNPNVINLGLTEYTNARISIRKQQTKQIMRETIHHELVHIHHELVHAFIFSYGCHMQGEESVCDFVGAHVDGIVKLTNKIMERWHEDVKRSGNTTIYKR